MSDVSVFYTAGPEADTANVVEGFRELADIAFKKLSAGLVKDGGQRSFVDTKEEAQALGAMPPVSEHLFKITIERI